MKVFKILLCSLFFSVSLVSVSFANTLNTTLGVMDIKAIWSQTTGEVQFSTSIAMNSQPTSDMIIEVTINNITYKKTFDYNQTTKKLSSSIIIPYTTAEVSYKYAISIKNTSNKQIIATSGTEVFQKGTIVSTNSFTGTTSTGSVSSTGSTSVVVITGLTAQETKDVNTATNILLKDIYTKNTTSLTRMAEISKTIITLEAYIIKNPTRKKVISGIIANLKAVNNVLSGVKVPASGTFTPKYSSQSAEPSKINGIGNRKSYDSWRVPQK